LTPPFLLINKQLFILSYLKNAPGLGIYISLTTIILSSSLLDWSGCHDTCGSVIGFAVYLGSSLVSWWSKKQETVSGSSYEAKYCVLATTTCEFLVADVFSSLYHCQSHFSWKNKAHWNLLSYCSKKGQLGFTQTVISFFISSVNWCPHKGFITCWFCTFHSNLGMSNINSQLVGGSYLKLVFNHP